MIFKADKVKAVKRWWRRVQFYLPHPNFFVLSSLFIVAFAHIDRSSTAVPLSSSEILKASIEATPAPKAVVEEKPVLPSLAWGFFTPSWKAKSNWLFTSNSNSTDPVTNQAWSAGILLEDPEGRIEKEFVVPPALKDRVLFWVNVYGRFPSHIRIVHDRNDMSIIYGYIDLRPIFRAYGATEMAERKAANVEKNVIAELKHKIIEVTNSKRSPTLTSDDRSALRELLSRAGALSAKDALQITERIRTQTGQRDMFLAALQRSRNLLPHIESVFKRNGLPAGLAHIPFVESSFNSNALSKIGAVGIWQFTPETAREFIHPDEATVWADPLKQTQSAARMLRNYRGALPDWGTAITSYNSGIGRVRRMIEKHKITCISDLLKTDDTNGLGFAGKNFYSEFLAAHIVESYREEVFGPEAGSADSMLVFKGKSVFPNQSCDL